MAGMPRPDSPGGGRIGGSVAVATVGTTPDEAETFAFLVIEEVGVDWSGEARIVQL